MYQLHHLRMPDASSQTFLTGCLLYPVLYPLSYSVANFPRLCAQKSPTLRFNFPAL